MHEMRENVTSDVCFGVFKGFANNDTELSSQKSFFVYLELRRENGSILKDIFLKSVNNVQNYTDSSYLFLSFSLSLPLSFMDSNLDQRKQLTTIEFSKGMIMIVGIFNIDVIFEVL